MEIQQTWTKESLRRSMRERLRAAADDELQAWSAELVARLRQHAVFTSQPEGRTIALFGGLRNEPDLVTTFLPWLWQRGWRAVFFAMAGHELLPMAVASPGDLQRGTLGVWVPVSAPPISPADLDVILVPGLAFAASDGARLGRGGGFYDRFLARPEVRARRVGIAFEMQVLPRIPCEPHDLHVDEIVTECR